MSEQQQDDLHYIAITRRQASLIVDSFRISVQVDQPTIWTLEARDLALKAAALVLEIEAAEAGRQAEQLLAAHAVTKADMEILHEPGRRPDATPER